MKMINNKITLITILLASLVSYKPALAEHNNDRCKLGGYWTQMQRADPCPGYGLGNIQRKFSDPPVKRQGSNLETYEPTTTGPSAKTQPNPALEINERYTERCKLGGYWTQMQRADPCPGYMPYTFKIFQQ